MVDSSVMSAIFILTFYFGFCLWYGTSYAKKTKVDAGLAVILCLILSPVIAGIVLGFFPAREVKITPEPEKKGAVMQLSQPIPAPVPKTPRKPIKFRLPLWIKKMAWRSILRTIMILAIIVVIFLFLTNPSYEAFQQFVPATKTAREHAEWRRIHNYGIYSIYEKDNYEIGDEGFSLVSSQRYVGFLLNFTPVK